MSENDLILYSTDDGKAQFVLRELGGSAWLSQADMALLYQVTPQAITQHVQAIYVEGELTAQATCKENLQVQTEGTRQVRRSVKQYSLPMILAVGYRVRSPRGTQFRQWATRSLAEYLVKGFVMDDERLKEPGRDYFDELLERIRDIRASEKRFYQKVRDLFTLAEDYQANRQLTQQFFAQVQNKMFFAVTGKTAAELVMSRANPDDPHMGLTSWKGGVVRKADIVIAKNYLQSDELDTLNRFVTMFLEFAELRAKQKQHLCMADWRNYVDSFMQFNEQPLFAGRGSVSHDEMKKWVHAQYSVFDQRRKTADAQLANQQELEALEQLAKSVQKSQQDKEV